jgi:hypothetical protein
MTVHDVDNSAVDQSVGELNLPLSGVANCQAIAISRQLDVGFRLFHIRNQRQKMKLSSKISISMLVDFSSLATADCI